MAGIALISFSNAALELNPMGDLLAVAAACIWAAYSTLTKKISSFGYNTIQTTRRTFFYGLIFMLPIIFFTGFQMNLKSLIDPQNLFNLLFLGLGASALCFVTWNSAVKTLGPIRTSVYIYMVPVITTAAAALILHETITWQMLAGILLTLLGLFLSEKHKKEN